MIVGFAYARSQILERSMDRDVNAMTGSVRHMMGRPVEVRAVSDSLKTPFPLSALVTSYLRTGFNIGCLV